MESHQQKERLTTDYKDCKEKDPADNQTDNILSTKYYSHTNLVAYKVLNTLEYACCLQKNTITKSLFLIRTPHPPQDNINFVFKEISKSIGIFY